MTDRQVAYTLVTLVLLGLLAFWLLIATAPQVAIGGQMPVDQCFAMEHQRDCRACCVGLGGGKGNCARGCAQSRKPVSYSGLP